MKRILVLGAVLVLSASAMADLCSSASSSFSDLRSQYSSANVSPANLAPSYQCQEVGSGLCSASFQLSLKKDAQGALELSAPGTGLDGLALLATPAGLEAQLPSEAPTNVSKVYFRLSAEGDLIGEALMESSSLDAVPSLALPGNSVMTYLSCLSR